MPRYTSRKKRTATRKRNAVRAQLPRDKRQLAHWAVRGTDADYAKLRRHAETALQEAPSYVSREAQEQLRTVTRRSMLQNIYAEPPGGSWFSDGLSWLIDQVPDNWGFDFAKGIGQAALKPFRGDNMSEVDQQYARLVNEAYKTAAERDPQFEHWAHQEQYDSDYVTVYDNEDGHRFIAVRGTKLDNPQDLAEDARILQDGIPDNLIGSELKRIVDDTRPDKTIDLGAHSLATSLTLAAYEQDEHLQNRIHQTYLYNPAYSPLAGTNVTEKYEKDDRVRYFIDLMDPVSVGGLGSRGPRNVVYRGTYHFNPLSAHKLEQWGGAEGLAEHDEPPLRPDLVHHTVKGELPVDTNRDGVPDSLHGMAVGAHDDFELDLGQGFDPQSWQQYMES
ncbi:MAG: hypothetical protein CMH98_04555 [Oceanospirillaceae bacterium]|nr:hypothetical protein [Oceanospirillaceae bacterium]